MLRRSFATRQRRNARRIQREPGHRILPMQTGSQSERFYRNLYRAVDRRPAWSAAASNSISYCVRRGGFYGHCARTLRASKNSLTCRRQNQRQKNYVHLSGIATLNSSCKNFHLFASSNFEWKKTRAHCEKFGQSIKTTSKKQMCSGSF